MFGQPSKETPDPAGEPEEMPEVSAPPVPMCDGSAVEPFSYDPEERFHDEALLPGGAPRPLYAEVFRRLSDAGIADLGEAVLAAAAAAGVSFGGEEDPRRFHVDAVPRLFGREEWAALEAGLIQRTRALDAFVADVYGPRAIIEAGRVPAYVIDTCDHFEPRLAEIETPAISIAVAGLDVVRDAGGELRVLEDNVRTPSGIAYMLAARESLEAALPG